MNTLLVLSLLVTACYSANIDFTHCGPVCMIYCFHGNVLDSNGCPTCRCNPDPIQTTAKAVICHPNLCAVYCPHGFETDSNGCEMCSCKSAYPDVLVAS